ncbi:hypothetical protein AB0I53_41245 [Saccharopolyspora sp. NPDC050389]|uniref:hypothetical protein n=1 Tax=Saccharopolyspora sp. NPDC050389 TaxID=3155516 RepID=UPI0033EABF59
MQESRTMPWAWISDGGEARYVQYRRGVVPEWCRFSHIVCRTRESLIISWCSQAFEFDEVEECSQPDGPNPGLARAVRQCTDCIVSAAFGSADGQGESDASVTGGIPVRIDTPGQMVLAMRLLQGDLAGEAEQIALGAVDTGSLGCLAAETERFARALRRFGWLAAQR